MSDLLQVEREKYTQMWAVDQYRESSPGEQYVPVFLDMARPGPNASILDAGCGAGRGAIALQALGFAVSGCDLTQPDDFPADIPFTEACLWKPLADAAVPVHDWVYCCDVLEHIPTALTMLVAARLLETARHGVFFSIGFTVDTKGVWIGQTLHETVQPFVWWRDQLNAIGRVVEARDLLLGGAFLVMPC